jgi:hypothetical protein
MPGCSLLEHGLIDNSIRMGPSKVCHPNSYGNYHTHTLPPWRDDYPLHPPTHNMHTPSNAPHNPLQAAWLVNTEGPRQRRPVPLFGALAPPDMDLRNVGEGLASRLVRGAGAGQGSGLEQHRRPGRGAGAGAGVACNGQRGSLAPPPAGALTPNLN